VVEVPNAGLGVCKLFEDKQAGKAGDAVDGTLIDLSKDVRVAWK
jgi:hypothetical protein